MNRADFTQFKTYKTTTEKMTGQEKAKQLIEIFEEYSQAYIRGGFDNPVFSELYSAKQNAIKCVDAIYEENEMMLKWVDEDVNRIKDIGFFLIGRQRFWEDVKYELERI